MALVPKARTLFLAGLLGGSLVLVVSLVARAEPAVATYYGGEYVGAPTASGQLYDPNDYTAAHPYLPFGTKLLVSHNGQSVIVMVNDSCFCGLDLSLAAAQALGLTDLGIAVVDVKVLETEAVPISSTSIEDQDPERYWPPASTAPEVEPSPPPDVSPTVEDQPSSAVALEDEASPTPPSDLTEWPILGLVVPPSNLAIKHVANRWRNDGRKSR